MNKQLRKRTTQRSGFVYPRRNIYFRIDINLESIVIGGLLLAGLYFLWLIRDLVVLLFIAFLISSLLRNVAYKLYRATNKRFSIRTWFILSFVFFYSFFFGAFVQLAVIFIQELGGLAREISQGGLDNMFRGGGILPAEVSAQLAVAFEGLLRKAISVESTVSGAKFLLDLIPSAIFLVLATWYLLIDRDNLINNALMLTRYSTIKKRISYIFYRLEAEIGEWAKGQFLLMLIIGIFSYIGLSVLGIKYALVLAVISGLLEVIPTFGPVMASLPAIAIALLEGGVVKALLVIAFYVVLQQTENAFLVPKVMNQVIGIHPFLALIAIMIGQALYGAVGGLLAIPLYVFVNTLVQVMHNRGERQKFNRTRGSK